MKILVIMLSIGMSVQAAQSGNGGDVLTCPADVVNEQIKPIELLDFYEGRSLRQVNYNLGEPHLSVSEKVAIYLTRLSRLAPKKADALRALAEPLLKDIEAYRAGSVSGFEVTRFVDQELMDLPDSQHLSFPIGCKVEQLIIRQTHLLPGDSLYTINTRLLDKLDNDNVAGMILHESIFGFYIDNYKHTNSRGARFVNINLASTEFEKLNLRQYVEMLRLVLIPEFEYGDQTTLETETAIFDVSGVPKYARTKKYKQISYIFEFTGPASFYYFPSGTLEFSTLPVYTKIPGNSEDDFLSNEIFYFPNGVIREIRALETGPKQSYLFNKDGAKIGEIRERKSKYGSLRYINTDQRKVFEAKEIKIYNYDLSPLLPHKGAVDSLIESPTMKINQIGGFIDPTLRGRRLLYGDVDFLCKQLGYNRLITFRSDHGGFFGKKYVYWSEEKKSWLDSFGKSYDGGFLSEFYCEGYIQ